MSPGFKFAFVSACLVVALISGFKCRSRRDWLWLVGAMMFTVLSDSYLVLHHEHALGVATFCFTHICYIFRVVNFKKYSELIRNRSRLSRQNRFSLNSLYMLAPIFIFAIVWGAALAMSSVVVLALLYGALFAVNIFVNAKARRPKINYILVMAGLIFFALCDVNVMLFNLQQYTGASFEFPAAFALIWIFYLPSQVLLAISSLAFNGKPKIC